MKATSSSASYWSGITVDGVHIPPFEAYAGAIYWLRDFEAKLPKKAAEMKAYSDAQGWSRAMHEKQWIRALYDWYCKKAKAAA